MVYFHVGSPVTVGIDSNPGFFKRFCGYVSGEGQVSLSSVSYKHARSTSKPRRRAFFSDLGTESTEEVQSTHSQ